MATSPNDWIVLELSDLRIFEQPILFMSEPGYWNPDESELQNLSRYLEQGGMLVLDDFRGTGEWIHVQALLHQILPERSLQDLTLEDGPFNALFPLESVDIPTPYDVPGTPVVRGIKNDAGCLMVVAFFNTDLGDFWEWSGRLADSPNAEMFRLSLEIGANTVATALLR